jgi:hypothetical protein
MGGFVDKDIFCHAPLRYKAYGFSATPDEHGDSYRGQGRGGVRIQIAS